MVFMENNRVCSFTFIEKEIFDGHPEFLSVGNTFGVKLLKYCFWCVLELLHLHIYSFALCRSNSSEVFLGKGVLKICSKFKGVHPYRSVISTKLQNNFIEIALRHGYYPVNLLHIFGTPFPKNNFGGLYSSLEFWQFTIVRDLLKLLFDFITISILRFFVITELLLYLIFFCLLGGK